MDPIRYVVNKKKLMEPPPHDENNRMTYVVALEEDGHARDVTRRYASEYLGKTVKSRVGVKNGQEEWWTRVMGILARPYRLVSPVLAIAFGCLTSSQQRDDIEDDELEAAQYSGGMPNSIAGFKNHPLYVFWFAA